MIILLPIIIFRNKLIIKIHFYSKIENYEKIKKYISFLIKLIKYIHPDKTILSKSNSIFSTTVLFSLTTKESKCTTGWETMSYWVIFQVWSNHNNRYTEQLKKQICLWKWNEIIFLFTRRKLITQSTSWNMNK